LEEKERRTTYPWAGSPLAGWKNREYKGMVGKGNGKINSQTLNKPAKGGICDAWALVLLVLHFSGYAGFHCQKPQKNNTCQFNFKACITESYYK
jgi:hypothetical protein